VRVNENLSLRNVERWPARPYTSSGAGSGVVLRHRAAAAVSLWNVDACGCGNSILHAGQRSSDLAFRWFPAQPLPKFKGRYNRRFFSDMVFCNCGLSFSHI